MIKSDEDKYIMIPNMTVQNINFGEEVGLSYVRLFGKKTVAYLRQLLELQNVKGYSYFSSNEILWMSKIQGNVQRERKYFKKFLMQLKENSLIDCLDDIENMSADGFMRVKMEVYKRNDKGQVQNYFKLEDSEFNTIMYDYSGSLDRYNLLNLFCNLKSRIRRNAEGVSTMDRKPEVCYPSYETIKNDISIGSDKTLKLYIDALVELNLIRYDCAGDMIIETDGQIERRNSNFIYTLCTQGWENELQESIIAFKNKKMKEGWKFLSKEKVTSANKRRVITQKIHSLEKKTTLTQSQKEELVKLKQEKENLSSEKARELEREALIRAFRSKAINSNLGKQSTIT